MAERYGNRILTALVLLALTMVLGAASVYADDLYFADESGNALSTYSSTSVSGATAISTPRGEYGTHYSYKIYAAGGSPESEGAYSFSIASTAESGLSSYTSNGISFTAVEKTDSEAAHLLIDGDPTNASGAAITLSVSDGTSSLSYRVEVSINPIYVSFRNNAESVVYDGTPKTPDVTPISESDEEGDPRNYSSWIKGRQYYVSFKANKKRVTSATDVGTYWLEMDVWAPGYYFNSITPSRQFVISPMSQTMTVGKRYFYQSRPAEELTEAQEEALKEEIDSMIRAAISFEPEEAQEELLSSVTISYNKMVGSDTESVDGIPTEIASYNVHIYSGSGTNYSEQSATAVLRITAEPAESVSEAGNSIAAQADYDADSFAESYTYDGVYYSPNAWGASAADAASGNLDMAADTYFIFTERDPQIFESTAAYEASVRNTIAGLEKKIFGNGAEQAGSIYIKAIDAEDSAKAALESWTVEDGVYTVSYSFENSLYGNSTAERNVVVLSRRTGDINGDRNVNLADYERALRYTRSSGATLSLAELAVAADLSAAERLLLYRVADVAASFGTVDESDAGAILKKRITPISVSYYAFGR